MQQVIPEPGVPLQPPGGAPHLLRLRKSQQRRVSLICFFPNQITIIRPTFNECIAAVSLRHMSINSIDRTFDFEINGNSPWVMNIEIDKKWIDVKKRNTKKTARNM